MDRYGSRSRCEHRGNRGGGGGKSPGAFRAAPRRCDRHLSEPPVSPGPVERGMSMWSVTKLTATALGAALLLLGLVACRNEAQSAEGGGASLTITAPTE